MRVAVVGNGPSAVGQGERIDSLDFVVRCTAWRGVFPDGEVGSKCDSWAWYGHPMTVEACGGVPEGDYEFWNTVPATIQEDQGNLGHLVACLGKRRLRTVTSEEHSEMGAWISQHSRALDWANPSTGFSAIGLVMNRLFYEPGVSELHLFGFDATRPEQPGWGEARETACKWPERFGADSHDHETEKRLLWQLVHERTWLGRIVGGLPVHWHAAPEVVA